MNTDQRVSTGLVSASDHQSGSGIDSEKREQQAVLGRHTVKRTDVSALDPIGIGVMGGVAGAAVGGVVKAVTGCSWKTVAWIGGAGVTAFVLGTQASVRPITPLEHAQQALAKLRKDKGRLLEKALDNPHYQFTGREIYTIKLLSERYKESWETISLLSAGIYSSKLRGDFEAFLQEIFSALCQHGLSKDHVIRIIEKMEDTNSLAEAMALTEFQALRVSTDTYTNAREELARVMFTYSRILLAAGENPRGVTAYDLYQNLCREKYGDFKARIEADENRLENDIRILQAMAEQQSRSAGLS